MRSNIKGVSPEWYTLSVDEGEPDPVQFYIKPLSSFDWMDVMAMSTAQADDMFAVGMAGIKLGFRLGVKAWRNIEDVDKPGEQLKFSRAAMETLPVGWLMEVGQRVLELSRVSQDREKNSDSLSSSPATARSSLASAGDATAPPGDSETPG